MKRPPLGIMPYKIWVEQLIINHLEERISELKRAITDYVNAEVHVPTEWIEEYNNLILRMEIRENE